MGETVGNKEWKKCPCMFLSALQNGFLVVVIVPMSIVGWRWCWWNILYISIVCLSAISCIFLLHFYFYIIMWRHICLGTNYYSRKNHLKMETWLWKDCYLFGLLEEEKEISLRVMGNLPAPREAVWHNLNIWKCVIKSTAHFVRCKLGWRICSLQSCIMQWWCVYVLRVASQLVVGASQVSAWPTIFVHYYRIILLLPLLLLLLLSVSVRFDVFTHSYCNCSFHIFLEFLHSEL